MNSLATTRDSSSQAARAPISRTAALLTIILCLAAGLRCHELTARSLWFDEGSTIAYATSFTWDELLSRCARNVHPPGYYTALRMWLAATGESVGSLRGFSVACGVLTVWGSYFLTRDAVLVADEFPDDAARASAARAGCWSAFLVAVSSNQIVWSQQARMYTLGTLLTMFSTWCLLHAGRSRAAFWGYVVSATALVYTHNFGLFTVAAQGVATLAVWLWRRRSDATARSCAVAGLLAQALVAVAYSPWLFVLRDQARGVAEDYWTPALTATTIPHTVYRLFVPRSEITPAPIGWAIAACVGVLLLLGFSLRPGRGLLAAIGGLPLVFAAVASCLVTPLFVIRYLLFAQVGLLCCAGVLLGRIRHKEFQLLGATLLTVNGLWIHHSYLLDIAPHAENLRTVVAGMLAQRREPEPVVVVVPKLYHQTAFYCRPVLRPRLFVPDVAQVPNYYGRPTIRTEDVTTFDTWATAEGAAVWVIDAPGVNSPFSRQPDPAGWQPDDSPPISGIDGLLVPYEVTATRIVFRKSTSEN